MFHLKKRHHFLIHIEASGHPRPIGCGMSGVTALLGVFVETELWEAHVWEGRGRDGHFSLGTLSLRHWRQDRQRSPKGRD